LTAIDRFVGKGCREPKEREQKKTESIKSTTESYNKVQLPVCVWKLSIRKPPKPDRESLPLTLWVRFSARHLNGMDALLWPSLCMCVWNRFGIISNYPQGGAPFSLGLDLQLDSTRIDPKGERIDNLTKVDFFSLFSPQLTNSRYG